MTQIRFDGQVAVVTGAGGGLGRVYCLFFASRGAQVVVNDLGGSLQGSGMSTRAADRVVEEITRGGGKAVANYNSVEDGDKIIDTAIRHFGRVDVLINNAGVLRDVSFKKMSDGDWDLVLRVHLHGAYKCCAAAWPHFRRQKFGRIINTSSGAGLYGNFGQANYSAAKLALVGLTQVLAKEGYGDNILVNSICPIAASRMTETVMTEEHLRMINPQFVAPVVTFLASAINQVETGAIFEAGAGFVRKIRWERSRGLIVKQGTLLDPTSLMQRWDEINSFTSSLEHPTVPVLSSHDETGGVFGSRNAATLVSLQGQVAVVGGVTRAGCAYASLLAQMGASVLMLEDGGMVNNQIRGLDSQITVYPNLDTLKSVVENLGKVDIVVTTCEPPEPLYFDAHNTETWTHAVDSSLTSTSRLLRLLWPFFQDQKQGKAVLDISPVGIYGHPGQSAFASAMLGLLGLARTLKLEGNKRSIRVNTIARYSDQSISTASSLMAALCSDQLPAPQSGHLYEVGPDRVSRTRWQASGGWAFGVRRPYSPEDFFKKLQAVVSFDEAKAQHPDSAPEGAAYFFERATRESEEEATIAAKL